ncbi:MAG TPA: Ig-like domain repeat protein [Terracidiphilus sp.]|nr:Ig-like domain repeat protein [Terracidiphilus sp.]
MKGIWLRKPDHISRLILLSFALLSGSFASVAYGVQARSLITGQIDTSVVQPLPNHHPLWANSHNDAGAVAPNQILPALTLVLSRPPERQRAFDQFLAAQQDRKSPDYHHWLAPAEVGDRYGLSESDIGAITGWLQSQGLRVTWVTPSKMFIGFAGTAADVSRAFQTSLHQYTVKGRMLISVASDPMIPAAVAPAVKAIHGLYAIDEQPQHTTIAMQAASPEITNSSGLHFIGPGDFDQIYHLPPLGGVGITIGILGRSRTDAADFDNFKSMTGAGFTDPTEVVPTAYGGVDPGPAYTSPPGSGVSIAEQGEATLDVLRAGSVADAARLLLVVATAASGGIEADAQYLVNTTPVPVQVMTISYGACESSAGSSGVSYWDTLFQQAAAEGISTFVSSGDSGASGCDAAFQAPPATPQANSPNYLCSSAYATCVGGTEFNDTANPGTYWASASSGSGTTAFGYIPEGAWNESWDGTTSTVAASGGGVSSYIATPSWQQGIAGVPPLYAGRYTPDVSFSSSLHDGYFGCFAAGGGSCVISGGGYYFSVFGGTSAAAPGMAGIAALLDQNLGDAQGNLNPGLYQMTYGAPQAFHDTTTATSGVATCDLNTPSLCNSSIPGPTGLTGGQPGYAVATGYDEVTGLGSLDASNFVYSYGGASKINTPTISQSVPSTVPSNQPISIGIWVGSTPGVVLPTGTVTVTIGSYTSGLLTLNNSQASLTIPSGTIPVGNYTIDIAYTPDAASVPVYTSATSSAPFSVIVPPKVTPSLTLTPSRAIITNTQSMTVGVVVNAVQYYPPPTGSVVLTSGTYTSATVVLSGGTANISIPAGSLPVGDDTLIVTYTPDTASSSSYLVASSGTSVLNEGATITPTVDLAANPGYITTAQSLTVTVSLTGFTGNPTPTGSVVIASGAYTSPAATLANGMATFNVAAGTLSPGADTISATYTPDAQSSSLYSSASGSVLVDVSLAQKITPSASFMQLTANPTVADPVSLIITLSGGAGNPIPSGSASFSVDNYGSLSATLVAGSATVTIPVGALTGGANTIMVQYSTDAAASYYYNNESVTTTVNVAKATPAITVTPSASTLATTDSLSVVVTVNTPSGARIPTGDVTLSSGSYSTAAVPLSGGTATADIPAGSLLPGTDSLTASYTGDNNYNSASGSSTVSVTAPVGASFTVSGTPVTLAKGALTGNVSVVDVTPVSGFVGVVSLTASITGQPAGATNLPVLSFGNTSPVNVLGLSQAAARLTITTTGASIGAISHPVPPVESWRKAAGAILTCFLWFLIPPRRRRWRNYIGLLVLFVFLTAGLVSCGGNPSSSGGVSGSQGTTSGQYTITITGTSGSLTGSNTITLTVQ